MTAIEDADAPIDPGHHEEADREAMKELRAVAAVYGFAGAVRVRQYPHWRRPESAHEGQKMAGQRHSQFVNRQSDAAVALGWYCIAQGSNG